ncbi:MAG: hypothetical protein JJ992_16020 [Planctomycetes bacterium]|nr:hypothetical protein [Planctomycetota bacterium]
MARFQVGEIEEVYATGSLLLEPKLSEFGDIDTNVVTLRFSNGAVGVVETGVPRELGIEIADPYVCQRRADACQGFQLHAP